MLIFLAFPIAFYKIFFNFVCMKSQLFHEKPKTVQTHLGRWVRILPDNGEGYALHDLVHGEILGRILVDEKDFWIYDGLTLDLAEQEEVAGQIIGFQNEMDQLLKTLNFGD